MKSERNIRQMLQIGFQPWKEIFSADDTWVNIRDSIKASAKEKVGVLKTNRNEP